jgi:hypothetical protein
MLSQSEILYLNSGLDNKEIKGIKSKILTQKIGADVKNNLIKKGHLTKAEKLTPTGFAHMQALEKYKKSTKYITINQRIFGYDNESKAKWYYLNYDATKEEYGLGQMPTEIIADTIYNRLDYEETKEEVNSKIETEVKIADLLKNYEIEINPCIIKVENQGELENYIMYYEVNKKIYHYNIAKRTNQQISSETLKKELKKLFQTKEKINLL